MIILLMVAIIKLHVRKYILMAVTNNFNVRVGYIRDVKYNLEFYVLGRYYHYYYD